MNCKFRNSIIAANLLVALTGCKMTAKAECLFNVKLLLVVPLHPTQLFKLSHQKFSINMAELTFQIWMHPS